MFRAVITSGISLCRSSLQSLAKITSQSQKGIHTTSAALVLEKDNKSKKDAFKQSERRKIISFDGKEVDASSAEAEAYFPTEKTPNMLINGVRFVDLPIIHMSCSPNNTIMQLTDSTGQKSLGRTSCGKEGFRNARKSSTVAAQATGMSMGYIARSKGVEDVRVYIKGIGSGRMPALKGLHMSGVKIVSITDNTTISTNGPRPRKMRRL